MTKRAANAFSGINISLSIEPISFEIIESSSITQRFTSDNLFLKAGLDLLLKLPSFVPGLIPRSEWMVIPHKFMVNILVGSSKRTFVISQ